MAYKIVQFTVWSNYYIKQRIKKKRKGIVFQGYDIYQ